jgi:histidinol-phosphate aminotransferase
VVATGEKDVLEALSTVNRSVHSSDDMLRLHLNETVDGPGPAVLEALRRELSRPNRYPDPTCTELRELLARQHGMHPDQVAVGNGIDELLLVLALAHLGPGRVALTTAQTFPAYRTVSLVCRADLRLSPLRGYTVDVDAFEAALGAGIQVAFLCNPHNPTGTALSQAALERLVACSEAHGAILVCDEAYVEFGSEPLDFLPALAAKTDRLIVLRTFSKMLGLAGLRVGYALGSSGAMERVQRANSILPFSVNRLAQAAAVACVRSGVDVEARRERVARARATTYRLLDELHVEYVPSAANFVLLKLPGGDSRRMTEQLRVGHGILVRDTSDFALPGHIRVSLGTCEEMERFVDAMAALLGHQRWE